MKLCAHSLKGAAGYVGAGRIHYGCFYIIRAFYEKDYLAITDKYYPLVMEASIEYKRFSRKLIAEKNSKLA